MPFCLQTYFINPIRFFLNICIECIVPRKDLYTYVRGIYLLVNPPLCLSTVGHARTPKIGRWSPSNMKLDNFKCVHPLFPFQAPFKKQFNFCDMKKDSRWWFPSYTLLCSSTFCTNIYNCNNTKGIAGNTYDLEWNKIVFHCCLLVQWCWGYSTSFSFVANITAW